MKNKEIEKTDKVIMPSLPENNNPNAFADLTKVSIGNLGSDKEQKFREITQGIRLNYDIVKPIDFTPTVTYAEKSRETLGHILRDTIKAKAKKDREEEEIRRLTLEKLRKENEALTKNIPIYDSDSSCIIFRNRAFRIPTNSNQAKVCKVLFKDAESINKEWSWDEVVEAWGDTPDYTNDEGWKKVYDAGRHLNTRVSPSGVTDLFHSSTTKNIRINPNYL